MTYVFVLCRYVPLECVIRRTNNIVYIEPLFPKCMTIDWGSKKLSACFDEMIKVYYAYYLALLDFMNWNQTTKKQDDVTNTHIIA